MVNQPIFIRIGLGLSYGPFSKGMPRVWMIFILIFMKFIFMACFGPDTFLAGENPIRHFNSITSLE